MCSCAASSLKVLENKCVAPTKTKQWQWRGRSRVDELWCEKAVGIMKHTQPPYLFLYHWLEQYVLYTRGSWKVLWLFSQYLLLLKTCSRELLQYLGKVIGVKRANVPSDSVCCSRPATLLRWFESWWAVVSQHLRGKGNKDIPSSRTLTCWLMEVCWVEENWFALSLIVVEKSPGTCKAQTCDLLCRRNVDRKWYWTIFQKNALLTNSAHQRVLIIPSCYGFLS